MNCDGAPSERVVWSVAGSDGKPRLSLTECPSRALADPEVERVVWWWLQSVPWTVGLGGAVPAGPPEWPRRGGLLRQPARLVEAATILRDEWAHVMAPSAKGAARG